MIYKVRIMDSAKSDMRGIHKYIAEDLKNSVAAERRILLMRDKINSLKENPERFPLVRDEYLASKGYRMIVVKSHLVFFIIREKKQIVSIMRVLYGRRNWVRLLKVEGEK